jgi:hypothetical protein
MRSPPKSIKMAMPPEKDWLRDARALAGRTGRMFLCKSFAAMQLTALSQG